MPRMSKNSRQLKKKPPLHQTKKTQLNQLKPLKSPVKRELLVKNNGNLYE